ncbi:MAG: translation initiation factor IF-3 [Candidatus Pacebacteria bacterium CG10_big_fil_rev_8_21_14_0_10_44_11]|nr:MAG: translation initiation factor IF-3 [Candidatus Pacebacteria bacterium CG10_big_fil_rev_8_21_14_0_10_44_11]
MIRKRFVKRSQPSQIWVTANHHIRVPELRVLSEQGEMIGVMSTREAMEKSREAEKDLILINDKAQPPVAKIISLSKYKYQEQQKAAESRKKAKAQDTKEVRFTPFMGEGDYQSRLNKVVDFLKGGDKVRLSLQFKGRLITKKEFGYEMFKKVIVATEELATVEIQPKLLGNKLMAQLQPSAKKKV